MKNKKEINRPNESDVGGGGDVRVMLSGARTEGKAKPAKVQAWRAHKKIARAERHMYFSGSNIQIRLARFILSEAHQFVIAQGVISITN